MGDVGMSTNAIYEFASAGGNDVKAWWITAVSSVGLLGYSLSLFFQGLKANEDHIPERRNKRLKVVSIGFSIYILISALSNALTIGLESGQQVHSQSLVEQSNDYIDKHNKLIGDVNDAVLAFPSIKVHTEKWISCELKSGCLSKLGGGRADTGSQLESHLSAIQTANSSLVDFTQNHKGLRKKGNAILAEMRFVQENDRLSFDEKQAELKANIEKLSNIINSLKNIWPASVFDTLSEAYSKKSTTYQAEGIPSQASRELENYYLPKGEKYYALGIRLERAKRGYVPQWESPSQFGLLLKSNDIGYVLLISIVLAIATPLMLFFHVMSSASPENHRNDDDSNPPQLRNVTQQSSQPEADNSEAVAILRAASNQTKH
ncbi:MAG: hypothetical protein KUG81_02740 [Gammaproteobacteria bacterium]|nr:hypothetical protein [Gammaproteobacteria bacterium]